MSERDVLTFRPRDRGVAADEPPTHQEIVESAVRVMHCMEDTAVALSHLFVALGIIDAPEDERPS